MIAEVIYLACALTSAGCAILLWRAYAKKNVSLLFWCALGFAGLAANNLLLFLDKIVLPNIDLSTIRLIPAVIGFAVICFGLIWDGER